MIKIASLMSAILLLVSTLSLARFGRYGTNGKLVMYTELLLLPAFALSLWAAWLHIGWFTLALFACAAILVGVGHAMFARSVGNLMLPTVMFQLQPWAATIFLASLLACSVLAFI